MSEVHHVLFHGEDVHDSISLVNIVKAILPDGHFIESKVLRSPTILRRDAHPTKRRAMSLDIAEFAQTLNSRRRVIVVVHRDCDEVEPAHVANAEALEADLRSGGVPNPVAATPAWDIETWWMLFPEALAATKKCWSPVSYKNRNVGSIANGKKLSETIYALRTRSVVTTKKKIA
ncbi:MAG: hypothetical protein ACRYGM_19255 [Janthinobacterium lividum]